MPPPDSDGNVDASLRRASQPSGTLGIRSRRYVVRNHQHHGTRDTHHRRWGTVICRSNALHHGIPRRAIHSRQRSRSGWLLSQGCALRRVASAVFSFDEIPHDITRVIV